jgi:L-aspartate oxidase
VVGGGAAGLYTALAAADAGARVCVVSRKPLSESASFRAQGGLAAALTEDDSPERHADDTLKAGRAACRPAAVDILAREAPGAVEELHRLGVRFDTDGDGQLALGLEGGHSAHRIVHAGGSQTGRAITGRLAELVDAHDAIEALEETSATALWSDGERCAGVVTDRGAIAASATVLATGGGAALWERTTNPWGAIAAGAVVAHEGGAALADLELCQFHPTALSLPGDPRDGALLTEAIRGEGATLLDAAGERFTDELAPRDEVTAAILDRMDADGTGHVRLDMRGVDPERFPNVVATLGEAGIDPTREPVPVAPAAHYLIGGVATDLDSRTSVSGLLAVGECACTGVHGANRLASNSLLECLVFGRRAALAALDEPAPPRPVTKCHQAVKEAPVTPELREALWDDAGLIRNAGGVARLTSSPHLLASLVARSALAREESRGGHFREDFPEEDPALDGLHTVLRATREPELEPWN